MKRIIAIVMTLMLAATSLLMSGCGEDMAEVRDDSSGSTAKSVVWDYVSPSDLKGDTAKADASADNQTQDGQPPSSDAPSGEAPSGQPPEMPGGGAPGQGGPDTQSFDFSGEYSGKLTADGKGLM